MIKKVQKIISNCDKFDRQRVYDIVMLLIAAVTLMVTFVIGNSTKKLTVGQNELNNLYLPIVCKVDKGEAAYLYGNTGIPAYENVLSVTSGALKDISVILYNGEVCEVIGSEQLDIAKSGDYSYMFVNQNASDEIDLNQKFYDYFFVYTVSSSDVVALDCYYYEIDLQNGTNYGPYKLARTEMLTIQDKLVDGALLSTREDMIVKYYELVHMLNDILVTN